jgi:hypothetical protein
MSSSPRVPTKTRPSATVGTPRRQIPNTLQQETGFGQGLHSPATSMLFSIFQRRKRYSPAPSAPRRFAVLAHLRRAPFSRQVLLPTRAPCLLSPRWHYRSH